ncbi:hypothetical protein BaOVIS_017940 [Babesia ovis]|uniref:Uncharacterized protein n=1 Tax=Babesia ovis TaxID=5869 RepID=A0A9W5WUV9_BABOV|nr:hypothetical protein BaOVIS_017940 [Babesia ovis]
MCDFVSCRFGHSVDAFIARRNTDDALGQTGTDANTVDLERPEPIVNNGKQDDVSLYQNKMLLKEKVSQLTCHIPHNVNTESLWEQKLNAEESRQVIHGMWHMEQSDKFWDTLSKEEEINFPFKNLNPATLDDYVSGKFTVMPDFKSQHIKALLSDLIPNRKGATAGSGSHHEAAERIKHKSNIQLMMFGGAIPTAKQLQSCEGKLSLTSILDRIEDLKVTNELFTLTVKDGTGKWEEIEPIGTPSPRAFHATCIVYADIDTPLLCVTGGFGVKREIADMKLHVLPLLQDINGAKWIEIRTAGSIPKRRYGHTMGQVGEYLTIFGGTDGRRILNDLWVLNIHNGTCAPGAGKSTNEWKCVDILGPIPSPRCFHAAVKIGIEPSNPIIIYGGITANENSRIYSLNIDMFNELRWSLLPITVKGPIEKRAFHSMAYSNGEILITGGEDYTYEAPTVEQCLIYHIEAREFLHTEEALPLTGHRSVLINGRMAHFGGLKCHTTRVYLEPIYGPKGIEESVDIAEMIERQYIEEMLRRLEETELDRARAMEEEPCKNTLCAMQHHGVCSELQREVANVVGEPIDGLLNGVILSAQPVTIRESGVPTTSPSRVMSQMVTKKTAQSVSHTSPPTASIILDASDCANGTQCIPYLEIALSNPVSQGFPTAVSQASTPTASQQPRTTASQLIQQSVAQSQTFSIPPIASTRPKRQSAKICAQKIEEEAARRLAAEMQRENAGKQTENTVEVKPKTDP